MYVLWSDTNQQYYGYDEGNVGLVKTIGEAKKFSKFNPLRFLFKYYIEKYKNDDVMFRYVEGLSVDFDVSGKFGI